MCPSVHVFGGRRGVCGHQQLQQMYEQSLHQLFVVNKHRRHKM